jgi:hypothetical protein
MIMMTIILKFEIHLLQVVHIIIIAILFMTMENVSVVVVVCVIYLVMM